MNKFNIGDAVETYSGLKFVIKFIRLHPQLGLQYGNGAEASLLWQQDDLMMISAVPRTATAAIRNHLNHQFLRDIDKDDMYKVRVPGDVIFNTDGMSIPRKGFHLIKKTCSHKWKGIQISNTKTVYDCELCGIKKEDV